MIMDLEASSFWNLAQDENAMSFNDIYAVRYVIPIKLADYPEIEYPSQYAVAMTDSDMNFAEFHGANTFKEAQAKANETYLRMRERCE